MGTWAGFVRVSHMGARKSDDDDFHSERQQIEDMAAAVEKVNGTLHLLDPELDTKGGWTIEKRPSLRAAVEGVENGTYVGIVIAYHSRLGRNIEQEEAVWRRVEAAGGEILMALDGIDTSTADGRTFRRFRSVMNQAEAEKHGERFENHRRYATAAGIWQRRQTPKGYTRDPATRKLVPDDDALLVQWAFLAKATNVPVIQIAERLSMSRQGVRMLLRNRVYLGELAVGQHVNTAAHPAIITLDEFEAAQAPAPRPGLGPRAEPALLAKIVRCASCGHCMTRTSSRGRSAGYVYYTCAKHHSGGVCPVPVGVAVARLDDHVTEIALHHLAHLKVNSREANADLDNARAAVAHAERELDAYIEAVSAADIGASAFSAGANRRRAVITEARAELQRLLTLRPIAPINGNIRAAWEQLNGHERNTLLRGLLEAVIVRAVGRGQLVPVNDRARVIERGAGLVSAYRGGGRALPIVQLPWPDLDDDHVMRMPS